MSTYTSVRTRNLLLNLITYLLLSMGAVIMLTPFLWMVATSFKMPADQYTKTLIPNPATLNNFKELWSQLPFPDLLFNSFKLSTLITIGQLLTCTMSAFVFAVVNFRLRNILFALLMLTLMIPPQVTLIPNFIVFGWLHLVGTQVPLWLPAFWGGAFGTFLMRQYFLTIPRDLADAARVDGASLIQIFWHIYLQLAKPALAALAIFTFHGAWNDLLHPLVYLPTDMHKTTLTVGLAFFQQQLVQGGKFTVLLAGALISILPLILVFFIAQRQFIEGIALTGVKR
ncbi:MAG: carbohydrate ABC transporter permease [Anaerolineales bacterium]|nr:carbohydrate ABC transporter permease [Anaerolineales bacterium]